MDSGVGEVTQRSDILWAVVLERQHKGMCSVGSGVGEVTQRNDVPWAVVLER